ncbi:MAG TPA: AI-2E family transporter [Acidobacteriaceae bacterium]|nr:AI-2E family transporter [Acidobacteriaceae bacterium]
MARSNVSREISHLLAVVVGVVVIAALYLAKEVLLPLTLAMLFTFLLAPLVALLERIRIPRVLAILLVLAVFGSGAGTIGWTIVNQLVQVTSNLPAYRINISDKIALLHPTQDTSFTRARHEVEHLSEQLGITHPPSTSHHQRRELRDLGASPERPMAVQEVRSTTPSMDSLHGFLEPLAFVFLVVVFTFFMLLQRESLRNRLIRLSGHGHLNVMTQTMDEAGNRISRYFRLQLMVNICYGAIIFVALYFIGLPHAILWGSLAGLFRFIPYIGAPTAALLPTLLSMAVFHGWTRTLLIAALFFCMEVFTANFLEPHLYGKHTGLSSLAILVAAVFWTLIWGPIGLILSVPVTVCLVVIGSHVPQLEFLKVLLGAQPVMRPEAHYYQRLLANDEHEAAQVLETHLKENSLESLYDTVLIPALSLSEQDRHRNALDEGTITFINQATRELVDELGLHVIESTSPSEEPETKAQPDAKAAEEPAAAVRISPKKIACLPVRDNADEIIGVMLSQLLERAGHLADCLPLQSVDQMLAELASMKPDLVYLSALPPYALSHARGVYRKLRSRQPEMPIAIGLWNYSGDPVKVAREISGSDRVQIFTSLAAAVADADGTPPSQEPSSSNPSVVEGNANPAGETAS